MEELHVDRTRFEDASFEARFHRKEGIGTQNEKILHALLKKYFLAPGGVEEARAGRCICDLINPDGAVEIQTGSTFPLVPKLRALLPSMPVTVVLPLMRRKTLFWIDAAGGDLSGGRKSSKTGRLTDLLPSLLPLLEFFGNESFTLLFFLFDGEEYKVTGKGGGKGYGSRRVERVPTEPIALYRFRGSAEDFRALLPAGLGERFYRDGFARCARMRGLRLSSALKVLVRSGAVSVTAEGRKNLYTVCN